MTKNKNDLNISFYLKELLVNDIMADILDLARISDMGDRQFSQYSKSVKVKIYSIIREANACLLTTDKFTTAGTDDVLPKLKPKE